MQGFELIPYPAASLPRIQIGGTVERRGNRLSIRYEARGAVEDILFPAPSNPPVRRDELWKATCFEFFLAIPGQPRYREFNMSPSGDWNVYTMDAYRRVGFREETAFAELPFVFKKTADAARLDLSVDLGPILRPAQRIEAGITAILRTRDGNESYWALTHPGPQADFHLREGYILNL